MVFSLNVLESHTYLKKYQYTTIMNPIYEVFTNDDLLYEITKWNIVEYMNYPDIFIDNVIREDKNCLIKKALAQNFITLDEMDSMFYNDQYDLLTPKDWNGQSLLPKLRLSDPIKTNHEIIKYLTSGKYAFKDHQLNLKEKTQYSIFMILYLRNGNYEMVDFIRKRLPVNNEIIDQLFEKNVCHFMELNYTGFIKYFGIANFTKDTIPVLLSQPLTPETIELVRNFWKEEKNNLPISEIFDEKKYTDYCNFTKSIISGLLSHPLTPETIELIKEMNKGKKIKHIPNKLYATGNLKALKMLKETFNCKIEPGVINLGKLDKYTADELKWFIYEYLDTITKLNDRKEKKNKKVPKTQLGKDYKGSMDRFEKECMMKYGRVLYNRELYQDLENIMLFAFDSNNTELINEYMKSDHDVYINQNIITSIYYKGTQYYEFLYKKIKEFPIDHEKEDPLHEISLIFDTNIIINIFYTLNKMDELSTYIYKIKKGYDNKIILLNENAINNYIEKSSLTNNQIVVLIEHINHAELTLENHYIQKYEKYDKIYNVLINHLINIIDLYILDYNIQFNSSHILPFFNQKVYDKLIEKQIKYSNDNSNRYDDLLLVNCLISSKYYDLTCLKPTVKVEMTDQIYHKYKNHDLNTIINKSIIHNKSLLIFIEKYNINYQYNDSIILNEDEFFEMYKYHRLHKKSTDKLVGFIKNDCIERIFKFIISSDDIEMLTNFIQKHHLLLKYDKNMLRSIQHSEIRQLLLKYNVKYESSNDIKSYEKKYEIKEMIRMRNNQIIIPMNDPDKIDVKKLLEASNESLFYNNFIEPSDVNHSIIPKNFISSNSNWPKLSNKEEIEPEEIVTNDESDDDSNSDKEEPEKDEYEELYETVTEEIEVHTSLLVGYLDGRTNPVTTQKVMRHVKRLKKNIMDHEKNINTDNNDNTLNY